MQSVLNEAGRGAWEDVAPMLDEAMGELAERERNAVVLRFFEHKTAPEIARELNVSPEAASKRVSRALEKLRKFFGRRGVGLSSAALAGLLAANAAQAVPLGLATQVAASATHVATASAPALALAKGVMQQMAWLRCKVLAGCGGAALLAGGGLTLAVWPHAPAYEARMPALIGTVQDAAARVEVVGVPKGAGAQAPDLEEVGDEEPAFPSTATVHLSSPLGGVAVQPDGRIIVGGSALGFFVDPPSGTFRCWRAGALRLQPNGRLDPTFKCRTGSLGSFPFRDHVEVSADGRMLLSGWFDSVSGKPRPGYALLLPDGRVDASFEPWPGSTNYSQMALPSGVLPAALCRDGSVAAVSTETPGVRLLMAYRLDASGSMMPAAPKSVGALGSVGVWRPGPPAEGANELSDVEAGRLLGALFAEVPMELCRCAVGLPDGAAVVAVGDGPSPGPVRHARLLRFDRDWRPDPSFSAEFGDAGIASCVSLKVQPDGKLLIAGLLGKLNGAEFTGVARLDEHGALDPTFRCEAANIQPGPGMPPAVLGLALQGDGRIVICGYFVSVNGAECCHVARLNPDGSLDASFRTPFLTFHQFQQEGLKKLPVARLAQVGAVASAAGSGTEAPRAGPELITILAIALEGNATAVSFFGAPRREYVLQATRSLPSGQWVNVCTNQADGHGLAGLRDEESSKYPGRLYRVARP
jgi:uncharacterized delta-60 repeat protein